MIPGFLIAAIVAAVTQDAAAVALASQGRQRPEGPRRSPAWPSLAGRIRELPSSDRRALGSAWLEHLPKGWVAHPSQLEEAGWPGEPDPYYAWLPEPEDEGSGFWHVTTRLGQVHESGGLRPSKEVGRAGLGGGSYNVAPNRVSVTVTEGRARMLQRVLQLAVLAARDEIAASELAWELMEAYRPLRWWGDGTADLEGVRLSYLHNLLHDQRIPADILDDLSRQISDQAGQERAGELLKDTSPLYEDEVEGWHDLGETYEEIGETIEGYLDDPAWPRHALDTFIGNVEGNSWVPMRDIVEGRIHEADEALRLAERDGWSRGHLLYEMVRVIDRDLGDLASLAKMGLGITTPWSVMRELQPEGVRIVRVAARSDARVDPVPQEHELRFYPEDLALSPVVYGRSS
jgi:hypothetical protein